MQIVQPPQHNARAPRARLALSVLTLKTASGKNSLRRTASGKIALRKAAPCLALRRLAEINTSDCPVSNNRQLHISEVKWIEKNKKDFSQTLADTLGRTVTEQEAMAWLTMAGEGDVDRTYQTANGNLLGLQTSEERQAYNVAKQYIAKNSSDSFVDDRGQQQPLFVAKGDDFNNTNVNSQYRNDKAYRDFYWDVRGDNLKPDNPSPKELAVYNERERIRLINAAKQVATGAIPAVLAGATGKALDGGAKAGGAAKPAVTNTEGIKNSATPTGQNGSPMSVPRGTNKPTTIDGINYSGHSLDQMQGRGVPPSVVKNTIKNGTIYPTKPGTIGYYDSENNVRVITNSNTGLIITVIPGVP